MEFLGEIIAIRKGNCSGLIEDKLQNKNRTLYHDLLNIFSLGSVNSVNFNGSNAQCLIVSHRLTSVIQICTRIGRKFEDIK